MKTAARRTLAPLASALLLACQLTAAGADTVPAFDKIVSGLGYAITPETATMTAYFDTGEFPINYSFSADKTVAVLSISYDVKPELAGKLPALDMLKANAELTSSFLIRGSAAKPTAVALMRTLIVDGMTPVGLRREIDNLVANAKEYKALLDPEEWK